MLKFFRKIRYDFINKNKTTKYFKYAIGEIILVVTGILIALQINNWNENRKTFNNQEKYLVLLKKEAVNNHKALKKSQRFISELQKNQLKLLSLLDSKHDTISESYISELFFQIFNNTTKFDYQNNVLSELKTSGELKNITNDSIRNNLLDLEALVNKVQRQENYVVEDYKIADNFIQRFGSRRRIMEVAVGKGNTAFPKSNRMVSNIPLLKESEFENILVNYLGTTYNLFSNQYSELEKHLDTEIALISKELEQLN
jgi:hypothetical protein